MLHLRKYGPFGVLLTLGGVVGLYLFDPTSLLAQSAGVPPKITNIVITQPTSTSTLLTWDTDIVSDSEVNYGLDKNYGIARDPFPDKTHHTLLITDLESSMVYHMRIGSKDSGGNQALTGDYTVITKGVMSKKALEKIPVEDRVFVEHAIESIQKIKSSQGLKAVSEAVSEQAQKVLEKPKILGSVGPPSEIGSDYAIINWTTDQVSGGVVHFARDTEYDPNRENPYTTEAGESTERTEEHKVRVEGLSPGTLYHFNVVSESDLGLSGNSRDGTFVTKAVLPTVSAFRVMKVEADSATLAWRTSIPASGIVEYTDTKTKFVQSAGSPVFASSHNVKIAGLRLGGRYSAIVKAENTVGDKVSSNIIFFTTVRDTAPPTISKVSSDSTLYPSADAKVQTTATWNTDEPSYCQFFYRAGLNPNVEASGLGEEKEPRSAHVQVVVEFLPSTVYQFWIECRDNANNKAQSENFVLFTPDKEKSIIDIILQNFQGTFGWVKNIGK